MHNYLHVIHILDTVVMNIALGMKPCQTLEKESTQEMVRRRNKGAKTKVQASQQPKRGGESQGGKRTTKNPNPPKPSTSCMKHIN
jgi:hypothetical protein